MATPTVREIREITLTVDKYTDEVVSRAYEVVHHYMYDSYRGFDKDYLTSIVMQVEVAAVARALDEWTEYLKQLHQARLF